MYNINLGMVETLAFSVLILYVGKIIRSRIYVLEKFFIPAPVIGGTIFAVLTLAGKLTNTLTLTFDGSLRTLFMIAFFTTVGFSASISILKKGGIQVGFFLAVATGLVFIQNAVGISLAKLFHLNPLIGLAAGSVSLTGGHGNAGAFGPVLEAAGAQGASAVSIAAATFGLVSGCIIGGPIGKKLLKKYNLSGDDKSGIEATSSSMFISSEKITEENLTSSVSLLIGAMGAGMIINFLLKRVGVIIPIYIGPMLAAAVIRNIFDLKNIEMSHKPINAIGGISLSIFLSISLMTMRLWELSSLALPLIVILLVQTFVMGLYAYYITFYIMGRDYDSAVIACGHCGFGMGATPNAMANMETFTQGNFPSPKAFFVLPLVGALFIDFTNAAAITLFIELFS